MLTLSTKVVPTVAPTKASGWSEGVLTEEGVVPKALDGVKVAFAHAQQGKAAFDDIAVGHARPHRKLQIDQGIDVDALEAFADKSQSGVGAEVIGQFFDNKVGHVVFTCWVITACRLSR